MNMGRDERKAVLILEMKQVPPYFFGGGNVKIILCESGTSGAGKADAAATGVQTERIWYLCDGCGLEEQGKLF